MFSYTIPDEVKTKISGRFMRELLLQLSLVFPDLHAEDINFIAGTVGWNDAFTAACSECDCKWLADYADGLEWYDWDIFADELTEMALGQ